MKNSYVVVKLDLGPVLDETKMSNEDFSEMVKYVDLNSFPVEALYHVLTDLDTGKVISAENLQPKPLDIDSIVGVSL